jgi:hypothetical protein
MWVALFSPARFVNSRIKNEDRLSDNIFTMFFS